MKKMKLMTAAVFMIATGCFAMQQENVIVENKTGTILGLKWAKIGQEGEESRDLAKNQKLDLGTDVAYLKFSIGGAYHIWRLDKLNAMKRDRGIVAIQPQDLTSVADIEMPRRPVEQAGGAELEPEAQDGMALLDWFPRVKAKLIAKYTQPELARKSIAQIEKLINEAQQNGTILACDFFELNKGCSEADVRRVAEQLKARINQLRVKKEASTAARLLIDEAVGQAYRDLNK